MSRRRALALVLLALAAGGCASLSGHTSTARLNAGVPTADELASMVVELITNDYMTGEVIRVDGGIRMPPR